MFAKALLLSLHVVGIAAHFMLKYPPPYSLVECTPPHCKTMCPPLWMTGKGRARNTPKDAPSWARGEQLTLEWQRNNHDGGMYRLSLVPLQHMGDALWHTQTAFDWGCWSQGRKRCDGKRGPLEPCGTDQEGQCFSKQLAVPKVFPDGAYVLAMTWFGGLHWKMEKAGFNDYHTCAFVRIKGGPSSEVHRSSFTSGKDWTNAPNGTCRTAATSPGECGGYMCEGNNVTFEVPLLFRGGANDFGITRKSLVDAAASSESYAPTYDDDTHLPLMGRQAAYQSVYSSEGWEEKGLLEEFKETMFLTFTNLVLFSRRLATAVRELWETYQPTIEELLVTSCKPTLKVVSEEL